ncbi:NADH dehydrogenase subunit 4L (mitochondrion) [Cimex lectularius]|uniref:NADH-ubiquinone oxidoreductase chain 4L n=1 Tax=Cimex lectularius TaxID=79782 RepID=A0A342KAD6_CIMLE|nr:NADH dehydrogenase subunit 4L [Cimex lectularius]AMY59999.1 NADH dehydrogenase subunit 4L [Cimex lectularius]
MSGLFAYCSAYSHLLLMLLSLEYLVLILFLMFFVFFTGLGSGYYFILVFLSFSVCEGVLGLSLLVSLIRCHGNDNLMTMSMLVW